jgi:hypothetical protein
MFDPSAAKRTQTATVEELSIYIWFCLAFGGSTFQTGVLCVGMADNFTDVDLLSGNGTARDSSTNKRKPNEIQHEKGDPTAAKEKIHDKRKLRIGTETMR